MDAVVVIPALDPDARLIGLVDGLHERGFSKFIVVDDGSSDDAQEVFAALARRGIRMVRHPGNLGKGSAIKTAIAQMRLAYPTARFLVTVDADGQHSADDVLRVCQAAEKHPDAVVLGARNFSAQGVPLRSYMGNAFSSLYFALDTGVKCPDTQTGLRAIPRTLFSLAMRTQGSRYDYEMNFLTNVAKRGVSLQLVPIAAIYERGNAGSHFRVLQDSYLIYRQFIRFAGSSLACSAVDLAVFALLTAILGLDTAVTVAVATVIARLLSGALNFTINRTWSFSDSGSARGAVSVQAIRYGALFVVQMLASMVLVTCLSFLPLPLVAVKVLVDGSLFFVSHFIQKNWVFKPAAENGEPILLKGGSVDTHAITRSYRAA